MSAGMLTPDQTSAPAEAVPHFAAGSGHLALQRIGERTAITRLRHASPLKLLAPQSSRRSAWVYASTYGGGLLAGDTIALHVEMKAGTVCWLGTQASTKVYRSTDEKMSRQQLHATVDDNALLVVAPDPVCCFAAARYQQRQTFTLHPNANLVLLDWCLSGRHARGEHWAMGCYASTNVIQRSDQRLLHDALCLDPCDGPLQSNARCGRFVCLATLVIVGPQVTAMAQRAKQMVEAIPVQRRADLLIAASPLGEGVLLRLAGMSTDRVTAFVHHVMSPLAAPLGGDPWQRKW